MKESLLIRFLYQTIPGRSVLKLLVDPVLSKAAARYLSSMQSRWLISPFIRNHHIDMKQYQIPDGGYRSFNDFFTRKKKSQYTCPGDVTLVSPCDGWLTISNINKNSVFCIKHTQYSLKELLKDEELAEAYQGGTAFVFRLTPAHYHRYIWAAGGILRRRKRIHGILHSVRPLCHEKTKVFIQNTREFTVFTNPELGDVIQMEIGALLVGRISNHDLSGKRRIAAGEEKGFFEYGGSSIVLLVKSRPKISGKIRLRIDPEGTEIPISMGTKLIEREHGEIISKS